MLLASEIEAREEPTDRLIDICRAVQATHYLAGPGAGAYMDVRKFKESGLVLEIQGISTPSVSSGVINPLSVGFLRSTCYSIMEGTEWNFCESAESIRPCLSRPVHKPEPFVLGGGVSAQRMQSRKMRILAIGAHPDDIEAGCGGTLIKYAQGHHRIFLMVMTEGDKGARKGLRKREQKQAAKFLKTERIYWGGLSRYRTPARSKGDHQN